MRVLLKMFLLLVLNLSTYLFSHSQGNLVIKGELDLTKWDPQEQLVIPLSGEWRFYWRELVNANQLDAKPFSFAQLSIPWNEQSIDGKNFPKTGYATYALRIKLPTALKEVAFDVPAVFNCYAFWVNEKLICASGQVARNELETVPKWKPQTVLVKVPSQTITVLFQIANFQNTRGGCAEVMRIGNAEHLTWLNSVYHTSGRILIFFCALLGIGGIVIYYLSQASNFMYLSLLSFAYMLRFLFSDLYLAQDFGIELPWIICAKIEYATIPLIIITAAMFVANIYPKEFKRPVLVFFQLTCCISLVGIILMPSGGLTPLLTFLQILGLSLAFYSSYAILHAVSINRTGAWVSALGMGVFILVASYNIYAFIMVLDLNRAFIHAGYASALSLCAFSLLYRTPVQLKMEESETLRYEDLFPNHN